MHNIYKILQERPSSEYIIRSGKHVEPTPTPVKEVEQLDAVVEEVPAAEESTVVEETPATQDVEKIASSELPQTKKSTRKKKQ